MPGPWDKYAQPDDAGGKPWEKYAKAGAPAAPAAPQQAIGKVNVDEMPAGQVPTGEKVLGAIASPGFAMAQSAVHPIDSLMMLGKGVIDTPGEAGGRAAEDVKSAGRDIQRMMSPKDEGIGTRAWMGTRAALKGISAPLELPTTLLENTYGKLASEGSKMADPRFGKGIVSKEEASLLPSMMVGSKMGAAAKPAKSTDFANAATRMGMNFSAAKKPEDIATEIGRASKSYFDKLSNMIWDRSPERGPTKGLGETATNAYENFRARKEAETGLWNSSEKVANTIGYDAKSQVKALNDLREQVAKRIASGEDTPDVKKAQALVDRALGELGAPVQPEQQVLTKTTERGGITKTTTRDRQFAPEESETIKNVEPTTKTGGKQFSETQQDPVRSTTSAKDKTKTVTTDPYSITQRITKGAAAVPPRQATAGDLVRAAKASNDKLYSTADPAVAQKVKSILYDGLSDVSKNNKQFARYHTAARRATQGNADIYRDDARAAKYGFDEDTLNTVKTQLQGGRKLSTDILERINAGTSKIKSPEDLEFLKRYLNKPNFSMVLRAKAATILSDIGFDYDSVIQQRPMLEKIYEYSGVPKAKYSKALDDLETVSKEATKYKITAKPQVAPELGKEQARIDQLTKALQFSTILPNPKQGAYHAVQAIKPSPSSSELALKKFKKAATPKEPQSLTGAAVGYGMTKGHDDENSGR